MAYVSKEDVNCWHSIQLKVGSIFSHPVPFIYWINRSSFVIFSSSYDIPSDIYTNMRVTTNSSVSPFVTSHCSYMVWAPSNYDMTS